MAADSSPTPRATAVSHQPSEEGGGTPIHWSKPGGTRGRGGRPRTGGTDHSNVAILGFSSSGKTVYLTMLYYHTAVRGTGTRRNGDGENPWRADWMSLDDGVTKGYLTPFYCDILGVDAHGRKLFVDRTTKRAVVRRFPAGTNVQTELRFRLIYDNGIREHELNILTLETKGEAQLAYASDPAGLQPEQAKLWSRVREHCQNSSAVLLFFNLLVMADTDQTAQLRTMVDTLVHQARRPKVVAIVLTGADILRDAAKQAQAREHFIREYSKSLEQLDSHNIDWEVFLISSFGREFMRKKPDEFLSDSCRAHDHRCMECQEFNPDPEARPDPTDLMKPWDFIYEKVHRRSPWVDRFQVMYDGAKRRRWWLSAAAAGVVALTALGFYVRAQQKEREITALLASGTSAENLTKLIALDTELARDPFLRWFASDPSLLPPEAQRAQLRMLASGAAVFNDEQLPLDARILAAEATRARLRPPLDQFVPLRALQLEREISGITGGPDLVVRLEAANTALAKASRPLEEFPPVQKAVQGLLSDVAEWIATIRREIDGRMRLERPGSGEDIARATLANEMLTQLARGETGRLPEGRAIAGRLPALRDDLRRLAEFNRLASLPETTADETDTKAQALERFQQESSQHPLAFAAAAMQTDLRRRGLDQRAAREFEALPAYDPAAIANDLPRFVDILRRHRGFLERFAMSDQSTAVKKRVEQMRSDLQAQLGLSAQRTAEALAAFRALPPPAVPAVKDAEAHERAVFNNLEAIRTLDRSTGEAGLRELTQGLEELHGVTREYASLARLLAAIPAEPDRLEPAVQSLAAFAARLPEKHPARQWAVAEHDRQEDRWFLHLLQTESKKLAPPELLTADTADRAYADVLEQYEKFIRHWSTRLPEGPRRQRIDQLAAASQVKSPLAQALAARAEIQDRFEDRTLARKISAALRDPLRTQGRDTVLGWIDDYTRRFEKSPQAREFTEKRAAVAEWRQQVHRLGVQRVDVPSGREWMLTISIRQQGAERPVQVIPVPFVRAKEITQTIEFPAWEDLDYEVEVDLRRTGAPTASYAQKRPVRAGRHVEDLTQEFARVDGHTVKLVRR